MTFASRANLKVCIHVVNRVAEAGELDLFRGTLPGTEAWFSQIHGSIIPFGLRDSSTSIDEVSATFERDSMVLKYSMDHMFVKGCRNLDFPSYRQSVSSGKFLYIITNKKKIIRCAVIYCGPY